MPNKYLSKSILITLALSIILILSFTFLGQSALDEGALEKYKSIGSGVFAKGELAYRADGEDLGSESYTLTKREGGGIILNSEGVVTPPIPIPFVNPKIKFDQEIILESDFSPKSLYLNYDGPLGIGSEEINASVQNGKILAETDGEKRKGKTNSNDSFFQGTAGAKAITALILSQTDGPNSLTEILTGGSGPGNDSRLKALLELDRKEVQKIEVKDSDEIVYRYVLTDKEKGIDKVIIAKRGTFLAYLRTGGENPFRVYRSDLFDEDYDFKIQ